MNPGPQPVYSVTELLQNARALLEMRFPNVLVEGEIGRYTKHPSGHIYFDLKDEKGVVSCAFFRNSNMALAFQPTTGQKVLIAGGLSLFEARGQFQLIVRSMEPAGLGALQLAFEQLKQKLMAEGLFDESRKKPVPEHPQRVALITSPTGAALQDFMKILETRVGIEEVELFPAKVQGAEAPGELIEAIEEVSRRKEHDVLVLTRGGGSLEDLAAFNDEGVVRALADCSIPTVCAVGHEIDSSLCDFVADRREPTPTAAAAHLAPGRDEVQERLDLAAQRLKRALQTRLDEKREDLRGLLDVLSARRPDHLIAEAVQKLDRAQEDLQQALENKLEGHRRKLTDLSAFLSRATPLTRLKPLQEKLKGLEGRLQAYHPYGPLKRGYALVTQQATGSILRDAKTAIKGEKLDIRLQKGNVVSEVVSTQPENE